MNITITPQKQFEKKIFATVSEFFPDLNPVLEDGRITMDYRDDETSGRVFCLVEECLKW